MEKDYTKYSFRITVLVILIMLGLSFIPPFSIGGVTFRRTNIISSVYEFGDEHGPDREAVINAADRAFIKEMEAAAERAQAEGHEEPENGHTDRTPADIWDIGGNGTESIATGVVLSPDTDDSTLTEEEFIEKYAGVVQIEDFTPEGQPCLKDFCALLGTATNDRVVRIGFLGDSFIEGDIITADIREQLQTKYGGCGVGFVPTLSRTASNRPTVKHTFSGWDNYNLVHKKSAPEDAKDRFYISGVLSTASDKNPWSEYEMTRFRKHLNQVTSVRLLYTNTTDSEITLIVNDTIERRFGLEPDNQVQQIHIAGSSIKKLKMAVSDPEGFYGYGVVLEGRNGISVDNYSIRSNSGLPMAGTSASVNRRINRMLGYDMIVLQYGLNVMEADVTNYRNYGTQFRKMVNYIKSCFPDAVIVIMGIGDRSTMKDGDPVSMPGVRAMLREQREAAMECGTAFWSTYDAMGGENSMGRFVDNGWAAKDYTHLSFGGGRIIATEFVKALEYARAVSAVTGGDAEILEKDNRDIINSRIENLDTFSGKAEENLDDSDTGNVSGSQPAGQPTGQAGSATSGEATEVREESRKITDPADNNNERPDPASAAEDMDGADGDGIPEDEDTGSENDNGKPDRKKKRQKRARQDSE